MEPPSPSATVSRGQLLFLGALLLALAAFFWWTLDGAADDRERRSAAAPLLRLDAEETSWWSGEDDVDGYRYVYAFEAGGRTVEGAEDQDEFFDPARAYHVCYNPADPADHDLYPAATACGQR